jgi:ribosomal protein S18 acetylase RimI-like enzyme
MIHPATIEDAPPASRTSLLPLIDECFEGLYRWHARRTLRAVPWVRVTTRDGERIGLAMLTMLAPVSGYLYYIAVKPSQRAAGIGGLLLEDAVRVLRGAGACEIFACIRPDNVPSIRLMRSRGFARTRFSELARSRGVTRAVMLWIRMMAVPGEQVFLLDDAGGRGYA